MSGTGRFVFHRPRLAESLVSGLLGGELLDFSSGLFLSGPRRTGKSTFLKEDLMDLLRVRDLEVVYADLWKDKEADPAAVVMQALSVSLKATVAGPLQKVRAQAGLSKFSLAGFSLELDRIGQPDYLNLVDTLTLLAERSGKQVCLVVDEAQHVLSTANGINMMFSLKAARDGLNMGNGGLSRGVPGRNLMLVFTGSNRDKLASLVFDQKQAFYGARITPFPLLGSEFANEYCSWVNERVSQDRRFLPAEVATAFDLLWQQPEELAAAVQAAAMGSGNLLEEVGVIRAAAWLGHQAVYDSLGDVEQAVLSVLSDVENAYAPFAAETLKLYGEFVGTAVSKIEVQTAIETLRSRELLWRSEHGTYAFEKSGFKEWFADVRPGVRRSAATGSAADAPMMIEDLLGKGISIEALASMLLSSRTSLSKWRSGAAPKGRQHLDRIASVHGLLSARPESWAVILRKYPQIREILESRTVHWDDVATLLSKRATD